MTTALENLTNPTNLAAIAYPVYRLSLSKPLFIDGVIFYLRTYLEDDNTITNTLRIVDDTNVPGGTLALRRLFLLKQGIKLKPLGNAVFFLGDLVKLAKPKLWFIDSNGKVFNYKKSNNTKLTFRKIKRIFAIPTGGALLEVEGINSRFKCLYAPKPHETYAGILIQGMSFIFYGLFDQKYDDTRRKI